MRPAPGRRQDRRLPPTSNARPRAHLPGVVPLHPQPDARPHPPDEHTGVVIPPYPVSMDPNCIDCGTPVVTGKRCRPCNGAHIRLTTAYEMNDEDNALLDMVASERLSAGRLAARLGISRVVADRRIKNAEARQETLHGIRRVDGRPCWCHATPEMRSSREPWVHTRECEQQLDRVVGLMAREGVAP